MGKVRNSIILYEQRVHLVYSFEMSGLYDICRSNLEGGRELKKWHAPCSGVSFYNVQCICVTKIPLFAN